MPYFDLLETIAESTANPRFEVFEQQLSRAGFMERHCACRADSL
jgi:hypothetical protein